MSALTVAPTANDVRAWAKTKGITVPERGRLGSDVIERFNKGRKVKYEVTMIQPAKLLRIEGLRADKAGRNRKVVYTATHSELREWAASNGFQIAKGGGRIPADVLAAYGLREAAPAKG